MASIHSDSTTSHLPDKILQVWCLENSSRSLLQQVHTSLQSRLAEAKKQSCADLQLLDWSLNPPTKEYQAEQVVNSHGSLPHLPLLIVVDENLDLAACLLTARHIDISCCEIIYKHELRTTVLEVRINKLLLATNRLATTVPATTTGADNELATELTEDIKVSENFKTETILQTVMKHSNDWMVVKSLDNRFLYVSGKFCRAYGKTHDQIIGKNDLELGTPPELVFGKPGADWKGYWALDKEVTDSGIPVHSSPLLIDTDLGMYESMDKVPLRDENGDVFALVVSVYRFLQTKSDVAEKTDKFEEDGISTHLWDRKKVLSENPALFTINQQRKRAEELKYQSDRAFVAKNRFIATASHDLRQPLHALGLFVGALEPKVNEDGKTLVKNINSCVSALNKLLESLLDISKLDANVVSVEMSDFNVGDLLMSLQSEYHGIASDKSLNIYCSVDYSLVYSDEVLLRRILRNLLVNAINYTESGKVSLTSTVIGNHVEVVVADTGIGIPADQQDLVLEEFFKVETNPAEAQQGLGLGLSIVKRLCFILNIGLRLDSEVGVGTKVYLNIPMGSRESESVETLKGVGSDLSDQSGSDAAESPRPRKSLLVIDDDITVCEAVEAMLSSAGYEVTTATSPDTALMILRSVEELPDALLVDFRLAEDVNGIDTIEMLMKELAVSIPALLITGDTTGDGLKQITSSGYRHLHKPVEARILLQMVNDVVSS